jgi:hypothetical protein
MQMPKALSRNICASTLGKKRSNRRRVSVSSRLACSRGNASREWSSPTCKTSRRFAIPTQAREKPGAAAPSPRGKRSRADLLRIVKVIPPRLLVHRNDVRHAESSQDSIKSNRAPLACPAEFLCVTIDYFACPEDRRRSMRRRLHTPGPEALLPTNGIFRQRASTGSRWRKASSPPRT